MLHILCHCSFPGMVVLIIVGQYGLIGSAKLRVSKSDDNPNEEYYACMNRGTPRPGCKFFSMLLCGYSGTFTDGISFFSLGQSRHYHGNFFFTAICTFDT
jgi:hypothetical protein